MKLVFCGTPEFAVPSLEALLAAGHEVALVLTQPDRPAGRKMELQVSAVKKVAIERGLPLLQPEKIKANPELQVLLESIRPDAIIVVAYGRIIPEWMLALPRLGCINVHGSLLPKYRGAAPIQWAVANGEAETGITTMLLDSGLDTGLMLLSQSIFLSSDKMTSQLYPQLSHSGAELLLKTLQGLEAGTLEPQPQAEAQATLAPILTREDGRMDLTHRTAKQAYDRWRGFYPWPGAHGVFRNKRFLVHRMEPASAGMDLLPGVLGFGNGELFAGAAEGTALRLDEVQMEGKPRMAGAAFAKDFQVKAGERID
jgi:methionyl-tRNA formyltransferase